MFPDPSANWILYAFVGDSDTSKIPQIPSFYLQFQAKNMNKSYPCLAIIQEFKKNRKHDVFLIIKL